MLTRDSRIWNVLFAMGLAMAGALIVESDPAAYGLTAVQFKWAQLFAMGFIAAGKLGNSPLPGEHDR